MARKKNTGELEDRSIETKLKHKKEKKKFEKMNKALINYGTWSNGQTLCEFRISERDEKEIRAEKIYEDTSILNVKKISVHRFILFREAQEKYTKPYIGRLLKTKNLKSSGEKGTIPIK